MKYDTRYGKLTDGKFEYAPRSINGTANPPVETILAAGYLPLITDNKPTAVGVNYSPSGWEYNADRTAIQRTWEATPIVAPVIIKRYSKLKLITAAKAKGKWDALKAWIETAGYADEWQACMYLSDDYEGFDTIIAAIVAAGVATEDEIKEILAAAEDETLTTEG